MAVTYEKATLDNGLTIIAEVDPAAHSAAGGFFVRTGARDETGELMGVSHFLEHMMFKGTERRSADDINREFDEIGARYNAFTSSEMTVFHAQTLPELFPRAVDLLSDMMRPALRDADFEQERNVILEEIAMYKDNPFWVLYDEMNPRRYPNHPLGHLVLGTSDTIRAMERDAMRGYFDDRYSADNTTVALAGALDFPAVVGQIEELCGSWTNTGATRDASDPPAPTDEFTITSDRVQRAYTLLMAPAPAYADDRRPAAGPPAEEGRIETRAPDRELLLPEWLNALVHEMATRGMLFGRFDVQIRNRRLAATAWGEPVDLLRHRPAATVKGATYTGVKVRRRDDGFWVAECIVDV